jgi:hypothetical protein
VGNDLKVVQDLMNFYGWAFELCDGNESETEVWGGKEV